MSDTTRNMRQEELDGFYRDLFVFQILSEMRNGHKIRFVISKDGRFRLVEITQNNRGDWEFQIGDSGRYTHHLSSIVDILERIYDKWHVIILEGEIQINAIHIKANPGAEDDKNPNKPDIENIL